MPKIKVKRLKKNAVKIPGKSVRYSYNTDKHKLIDIIHKIIQKKHPRVSKEDVWKLVDEYEFLLVKLLVTRYNIKFKIPKLGSLHFRNGKKPKFVAFTEKGKEKFDDIFLNVKNK